MSDETLAKIVSQLQLENRLLQDRVAALTAELEAANREVDAFNYSVAHDLRAPLHTMDGFASILIEDFSPHLPAEAQHLLNRVTISAQRMDRLIDALQGLSRLGRRPLTQSAVSLAGPIRDVLEELRIEVPDRRIEIRDSELPDYLGDTTSATPDTRAIIEVRISELPDCMGDAALIRQAFFHLLSNALKFARHTERATVEVGCLQQDGQNVYFVRDNGAGFDMQYAERLFGVFQRFHGADEFEGLGVGLATVKRIIDRHGGRIWAEAAVDQGAGFYFTLTEVQS